MDKPVETFDTLAQQIRDLTTSVHERFDGIDKRFDGVDKRFEELKAQLRTEIESVRGDVQLIAEGLVAQHALHQQTEAEHRAFTERLNAHDSRILVLEQKKPI